jgi:hypothetical protein
MPPHPRRPRCRRYRAVRHPWTPVSAVLGLDGAVGLDEQNDGDVLCFGELFEGAGDLTDLIDAQPPRAVCRSDEFQTVNDDDSKLDVALRHSVLLAPDARCDLRDKARRHVNSQRQTFEMSASLIQAIKILFLELAPQDP